MRPNIIIISLAFMTALVSCRPETNKDESVATASAKAKGDKAPDKPAKPEKKAAPKPRVTPEDRPAVAEKESPVPDIPEGRSRPPSVQEWQAADPINTQEPNSQPENCEMKVVREWLKIYCHGNVSEYSEMSGFGEEHKDYFAALRKGKSADFVVRLRQGKTLKLKVRYADEPEAVLFVSWPAKEPKPVHIALGRGNPPDKQQEKKKKKKK